jgi:MoxR-like ATPase
MSLRKPLLLEGDAGVGKTECAKALAAVLGARLIRLQCYEGIDVAHALYDWNYARQMLYIRTLEAADAAQPERVNDVFGREFMLRRPLLDAIEHDDPAPPVLLIDEIDRADDEFEAFLLELLSDFQVTIPEIGTISATERPLVVLTSNRTRELHDALRRRCIYHWISYPTVEREVEIVQARLPDVPERLARQVATVVAGLRALELAKAPGIAETLDWAEALASLDRQELDEDVVDATLGAVLKYHEDIERVRHHGIGRLVAPLSSEPGS